MRNEYLNRYPQVFAKMTGLRLDEFEVLLADVQPRFGEAEMARLDRPGRQRALGGGRSSELDGRDQVLLTVIWLRQYPTHEVLGYLFGVSDSTVSRVIARVLPLLEQAGRDTMRMPDPGRKRRRDLDALLHDTPELAVIVDSFEQRVQRPQAASERDEWYSHKRFHSQVSSIHLLSDKLPSRSPVLAGPPAAPMPCLCVDVLPNSACCVSICDALTRRAT